MLGFEAPADLTARYRRQDRQPENLVESVRVPADTTDIARRSNQDCNIPMFTLFQQPEDAQTLNTRCKVLLTEILADAPATRESIEIGSDSELFKEPSSEGSLFLLREGTLSYSRDDRVLFLYEEGDLVGLDHCFGALPGRVHSDFAVVANEYGSEGLLAHVSADPHLFRLWNEYLACQIGLFASVSASLIKVEAKTTPKFQQYNEGDVIIKQGEVDNDVYTLLDGHADVCVDRIKVGEIDAEEIFGTIAALMDTPRTATVVATCDSTVLSLPTTSFVDLIEARPATVLKMVEDMASKIVRLNEKVVSLLGSSE